MHPFNAIVHKLVRQVLYTECSQTGHSLKNFDTPELVVAQICSVQGRLLVQLLALVPDA